MTGRAFRYLRSRIARLPPGKSLLFAALLAAAMPVLALNAPQQLDIPRLKERPAPPPAVFSHWGHDRLQCYGCHPAIFPQGRVGFSHAQMQEGRYCGACHDGRAATAISSLRCEACHAP